MDVNNVFFIINPVQNSNFLIDWIQSIIENTIVSVIGGIFAAVISVYITVEFTVLKGDAIKFNKIMIRVVFEIKEIRRKMDKPYFFDQIEKMRMKANKKKEGIYVWVGFDKEEYVESLITKFQYLPVYWLSIFFLQMYDLYCDDDKRISEKIQQIRTLQKLSLGFNQKVQSIENDLNFELKKFEMNINNPVSHEKFSLYNSIVEKHIESIIKIYNEEKFTFNDIIYKINPDDEEKLFVNVNFWPSLVRSIVKRK